MSKLKLYIAMSIDGYIATEADGLDWLESIEIPEDSDYGYAEFMRSVDVIIMGRRSYEAIVGFDVDWPYPEQRTYVVSRSSAFQSQTPNTEVLSAISATDLAAIQKSSKKGVWLLGGGQLISHCIGLNLVDEMILTVIPLTLGKGIRLFNAVDVQNEFRLIKTESFETGVVNLHYQR